LGLVPKQNNISFRMFLAINAKGNGGHLNIIKFMDFIVS
jgi:hypothetical protein